MTYTLASLFATSTGIVLVLDNALHVGLLRSLGAGMAAADVVEMKAAARAQKAGDVATSISQSTVTVQCFGYASRVLRNCLRL